jgi:hypothetical protein
MEKSCSPRNIYARKVAELDIKDLNSAYGYRGEVL